MNRVLHTIGHSNHGSAAFVDLLRRHAIDAIADVRSSPYSRVAPQFNREPLATLLRSRGIQYVFLGRELGARREERDCYVGSQARYDLIAKSRLFREGIERVLAGAASHAVGRAYVDHDHSLHDGRIASDDCGRDDVVLWLPGNLCELAEGRKAGSGLFHFHASALLDDEQLPELFGLAACVEQFLSFGRCGEDAFDGGGELEQTLPNECGAGLNGRSAAGNGSSQLAVPVVRQQRDHECGRRQNKDEKMASPSVHVVSRRNVVWSLRGINGPCGEDCSRFVSH